jgi:hypothetical protein
MLYDTSFLSLICIGSLAGPSGPAFLYRTFALGGLGGVAPQGCCTLWEVSNLDRWLAGLLAVWPGLLARPFFIELSPWGARARRKRGPHKL